MMTVYSSVSVPSVENTKSSSSSSKKSSRRTRTRSRSGLTSNCADLCSFSTKSIFQPFIRGPATLMTWAAGILYFLIIIGGPLPGEAPTFTLRGLSWVVGGHDYYQSLMASCYKDVIYPNTVSTSAKSSLESAVSATSKQYSSADEETDIQEAAEAKSIKSAIDQAEAEIVAEEEEEDAINEEAEALAEEIVAEKEEAELDQLDEQLAAQQSAEEIMVEENTEAEVEAELEAEAEDEAAEDAEDEDSEGQEDSMETVQDIGEDDVVVVVDMPTVDNGIVEIVTVVPENAFDGVAATDIDGANPDLVNLVATAEEVLIENGGIGEPSVEIIDGGRFASNQDAGADENEEEDEDEDDEGSEDDEDSEDEGPEANNGLDDIVVVSKKSKKAAKKLAKKLAKRAHKSAKKLIKRAHIHHNHEKAKRDGNSIYIGTPSEETCDYAFDKFEISWSDSYNVHSIQRVMTLSLHYFTFVASMTCLILGFKGSFDRAVTASKVSTGLALASLFMGIFTFYPIITTEHLMGDIKATWGGGIVMSLAGTILCAMSCFLWSSTRAVVIEKNSPYYKVEGSEDQYDDGEFL